ncbi:uncharacterized protein PV09_09623 [Verruconis gallopava]|uniref:UDP-N-acetylglucosamine transferase subunit ALG13 n=1 Tax=Verruconis gallopava TaxID=253628 RepID=A0A0D1ZX33_9PEZI|nr:uncharacterized protein PV09_09623 [Verruconis gallopava]KIV98589.1 hypothetical protein PV09_09623 [Verruconis gallopava]
MLERYCFVTVGATAAFDALVRAVLDASFLQALAKQGYTNILVQFGKDGRQLFTDLAVAIGRNGIYGLKVQGFDLTRKLREAMRLTRAEQGRREGIVICHAGTGSVLDAIRIGVPVIVVPNPTLLDNHQVEFAEQMANMEYAVHGKIDTLLESLEKAEELRKKIASRPPVNSGERRQSAGLGAVLDEEMGIEVAGHIE